MEILEEIINQIAQYEKVMNITEKLLLIGSLYLIAIGSYLLFTKHKKYVK